MKSKQNINPLPHTRHAFLEWYQGTPQGLALQQSEASYLVNNLKLTFNQKILQAGVLGSENDYIPMEFRRIFAICSETAEESSVAHYCFLSRFDDLAIATECVDFLILPHVLEFAVEPSRLLSEADRVLKADGQLIVLGLNPWSLQGLARQFPRKSFFRQNPSISCFRITEWLEALKFEVEFSAGFGVTGPGSVVKPDSLINKSMAHLAPAYALKAIKRTYRLISMRERWLASPGVIAGEVLETPLMRKNRQ